MAHEVAADGTYDLHALLMLVDRGCPAELAVRILAPLDQEERTLMTVRESDGVSVSPIVRPGAPPVQHDADAQSRALFRTTARRWR